MNGFCWLLQCFLCAICLTIYLHALPSLFCCTHDVDLFFLCWSGAPLLLLIKACSPGQFVTRLHQNAVVLVQMKIHLSWFGRTSIHACLQGDILICSSVNVSVQMQRNLPGVISFVDTRWKWWTRPMPESFTSGQKTSRTGWWKEIEKWRKLFLGLPHGKQFVFLRTLYSFPFSSCACRCMMNFAISHFPIFLVNFISRLVCENGNFWMLKVQTGGLKSKGGSRVFSGKL